MKIKIIIFAIAVLMLSGCGVRKEAEEFFEAPRHTLVSETDEAIKVTVTPMPTPTPTPIPTALTELKEEVKETAQVQEKIEATPELAEPEKTADEEKTQICSLLIKCDSVFASPDLVPTEKISVIPPDGILYSAQKVEFNEGESVFNVLLREMKRNKIHFEFTNTPVFQTAYIEGIGNLYEFDCGDLSGWMYKVNGEFPNYGCSNYSLKDGDAVEWLYTCSFGDDIGGYNDLSEER